MRLIGLGLAAVTAAIVYSSPPSYASCAATPTEAEFFEAKIRPVLVAKVLPTCHGPMQPNSRVYAWIRRPPS